MGVAFTDISCLSLFENKEATDMVTMKVSAGEMGPRTMEAFTSRLQTLLLQKMMEVIMLTCFI